MLGAACFLYLVRKPGPPRQSQLMARESRQAKAGERNSDERVVQAWHSQRTLFMARHSVVIVTGKLF